MAEIVADLNLGNLSLSNVHVEAGPSVLANTNTTLVHHTHSSRQLVVPQPSATRTYTLSNPLTPGVNYRFVYGGSAAAANNIIIKTETATHKLAGSIVHSSTDSGASQSVAADANTHDVLTLGYVQNMDITLTSNGTTTWNLFGNTTSNTSPAFSNT